MSSLRLAIKLSREEAAEYDLVAANAGRSGDSKISSVQGPSPIDTLDTAAGEGRRSGRRRQPSAKVRENDGVRVVEVDKQAPAPSAAPSKPAALRLEKLPSKPVRETPDGAAADLMALVLKSDALVPIKVKVAPILGASAGPKLAHADATSDNASVQESEPKRVTPSNAAVQASNPKRVTVTVAKPSRDTALGLTVRNAGISGVVVDRILADSIFASTELEVGMVLKSINGEQYDSFEDCLALFNDAEGGLTVVAVATVSSGSDGKHDDSDKENVAADKRKWPFDEAGQSEPTLKKKADGLQPKTLAEVLADPAAVIVNQSTSKWTVRSSRGTKIFQDELTTRALESLDDTSRGCNARHVKPLRDWVSVQLGAAPRYYKKAKGAQLYHLLVDEMAISQAIRDRVTSARTSERARRKRARAASASLSEADSSAWRALISARSQWSKQPLELLDDSDDESGYGSDDTLPLAATKPSFQAKTCPKSQQSDDLWGAVQIKQGEDFDSVDKCSGLRPYYQDTMPPSALLPALHAAAASTTYVSIDALTLAARKALSGRVQLKGRATKKAQAAAAKRVTVTVAKALKNARLGLGLGERKGSSIACINFIRADSLFAKTSLKPGMVLESVNGLEYKSFGHCLSLLKEAVGEVTIVAVA